MKTAATKQPGLVRRILRSVGLDVRSDFAGYKRLFQYMFGNTDTATGVVVGEETALTVAAWYNGVDLISNSMGVMPWFLYESIDGDERQVARDHPVFRLIHNRPNPRMSPFRFKKYLQTCKMNWGNGLAEIERGPADEPVALWPIHPSRAEVRIEKVDGKTTVWYEVKNDFGSPTPILQRNMFHIMTLSTDGWWGKSPIGLARETLGEAILGQRYAGRNLKNNATPSLVLEYDEELDPDAKMNLRNSWMAAYGGDNAGGVAILEYGVTAKAIGMSNEDAQFLQMRDRTILEIARWLNIPPHKLKELTHATFSNIEEMALEFVIDCLMPHVKDWEEEGNFKLLSASEQLTHYTEMLMDALLRGNSEARGKFYQLLFGVGALSSNDIRRKENWNAIEGGNRYFVPQNMVPLDRVDDMASVNTQGGATQNATPGDEDPDEPEEPRTDSMSTPTSDVIAAALASYTDVIASAFERMTKVEQTARRGAEKSKGGVKGWSGKFFAAFDVKVRDAVMPGVDGLSTMLYAVAGTTPRREWDEAVGALTAEAVEWFVADVQKQSVLPPRSYADEIAGGFRQLLKASDE